jgi:alginate production protein
MPRLASLFLSSALLIVTHAHAQNALPSPPREGQRVDDRRREQPFTLNAFGVPVELGGGWEYSYERRDDFDLDRANARNRRVGEHEFKLEARARPGAYTEVFAQVKGLYETRRTQGSAATRNKALERGQTWVQWSQLGGTPWALQAGRVALLDRRSWWWDDDLDALRLTYRSEVLRLDTGVARELARKSSADSSIAADARGVTRWFGQARLEHRPRHALEAFWLVARDSSSQPAAGTVFASEDDTDPSDLKGQWFGLRASGDWREAGAPRLLYWADAAMLRGREIATAFDEDASGNPLAAGSALRRVRGHALDVGVSAIFDAPLRPSVTLGHARGSGGERSASLDANFRQTGLQENKARLAGVKRWQIYGQLLQPELSNLRVGTVATGIRVLGNSSIELIAHRYRQDVASTELPGARLAAEPSGASRDIGRELDLVIAVREWPLIEFTFAWAHFKPGAAFVERDAARSVELGVTVNF